MADETKKKLAGKYDSPEALEKAYLDLETKLGTQGTELGEVKKLIAQYQPWVEKAIPVVEWLAVTGLMSLMPMIVHHLSEVRAAGARGVAGVSRSGFEN